MTEEHDERDADVDPKNGHDEDLAHDEGLRDDPRATAHPTGKAQAAENIENESVS